MAFVAQVGGKFATGDTVKAYPESNWLPHQRPPASGSTQVGSSADSATVAADGTVTLSGLTEDSTYYLTKDGSGVYVRARPDAVSNRQDPGGGSSAGTTQAVSGTVAVSSLPTVTPVATAAGQLRKTVTTAGTAVVLNGSALRIRRGVLCALSTNTGVVVVGGSGVIAAVGTRNSPFLNAGDTIELGSVDLNVTYIDSTVNGEGVTVYYEA